MLLNNSVTYVKIGKKTNAGQEDFIFSKFGDVYVRTPQAGLAFARAMDSKFAVEAL